ncbi:MAG: hypothetical protein ACI4PS_02720 [Rhodocyclaceae bacterium]
MFKKTLTAIIAATANKVFEKNPNFENELNFIERTLLPIYL